jgi:prepilin-type N-terminal cleavage/methylation domain-containing protein
MSKINRFPRAFTLVEIMFTMLIIGILVAIAVPSFVRSRANSRQKACVENMRQITAAKEQWAMDNHKSLSDAPVWPSDLVGFDKYIKEAAPSCPSDSSPYNPNEVNALPTCGSAAALTGPDVNGIPHVLGIPY